MKFSVIMPVYNGALYLEESINSVLNQIYKDWELIIVDDGSTDGSGEIADKYAALDDRISVIHQKNTGVFFARRNGIANARGDYILFLDCDDLMIDDTLDILEVVFDEHGSDVVMFAGERFGKENNCNNIVGVFSEGTEWMTPKEFQHLLISGNLCNSLCLKAFNRSVFEGDTTDYSRLGTLYIGEDKVQLLHVADRSTNIILVPRVFYRYRYNAESSIHLMSTDKIPHFMANKMFELMYEYAKKWGMDDADGRETMAVYYLRQFIQTFYMIKKCSKSKEERLEFKNCQWKGILDRRALKYSFSKKLSLKEKLKLGAALACVYL